MDAIDDLLFERLAWTSAQAVVLVLALWLLCHALPRLAPAVRCALWWLVALQLLLGLALPAPVKLPLLAAAPASVVAPTSAAAMPWLPASDRHRAVDASSVLVTPLADHATQWTPARIATALWLLVVLAQLAWLLRQGVAAWRLRRAAIPVDDPSLHALYAAQAHALGLRRPPPLRRSNAIDSPMVGGVVRPLILLPATQRLEGHELALALAHELAHVRRGDLYAGWLPALAQRLFFFHPLVGWAMREYALHREAACDAQVIERLDAGARDYGRLLVRLGVMPPRSAGLAGASSTFRHLKRRLTMLQQASNPSSRRRAWWLLVLLVLAGVLPYRVTAVDAWSAQPSRVPPPPPTLPMPPPPLPPPPPAAPPGARMTDIDVDDHATNGYALFDGDTYIVRGSAVDQTQGRRLQAAHDAFLWIRRGDKGYVTHDAATIAKAKTIFAPTTQLAREQGRLGGRQGELGGEQAGLAAIDASFAGEQASLAGEQAALAGRSIRAGDDQRAALDAERSALDARRAELQKRQSQRASDVAQQRKVLAERQAALARQMQVLDQRRQVAARQADQAMDTLLQQVLRQGIAQPVQAR